MTTALAAPPVPLFDVAQAERSLPVGAVAVPILPNNPLFDALDRFCKTIVTAHHLSPMTAQAYEWRLGSFFRWLRSRDVESVGAITYSHFEDYMADSKWASPATAHKFSCQCRKFQRWCRARGILTGDEKADFTGGFKAPGVPRGKPKSIPREDLVKLLDGARTFGRSGGRMELAVSLAGLAGLRRAEIMWVKWSDLDLVRNRLRVASPKTRRTGDHSVRSVPISSKLREILVRNRGGRLDEDPILDFPHFGGNTANGNRALVGLCRKVKVKPIGWHALRHTAATLMVQAGVDIERVRAFLGHRDLTMTSIYVQSKDSDLDSAAEAIL